MHDRRNLSTLPLIQTLHYSEVLEGFATPPRRVIEHMHAKQLKEGWEEGAEDRQREALY